MKKFIYGILIVLAILASCSKPQNDEEPGSLVNSTATVKDNVVDYGSKGEIPISEFPLPQEFCDTVQYQLIAGQSTDVGDIVVGNTQDAIFLSIHSNIGFTGTENVKIWIGTEMDFTSRPAPGQLPYKYTVANGVLDFYASWSFEELNITCEDKIYLIIHCDVPGNTAFGGRFGEILRGDGGNNSWWYYMQFQLDCCTSTSCKISLSSEITDVNCNGLETGAINLTVANGTAPYIFDWTGTNGYTATTEDLTGIPAGTYSVKVTDANKCEKELKDLEVKPATDCITCDLQADTDITDVNCNGLETGAINLTVTNGTDPLTYLWSNDATTEDLSGIPAGTYSVTITDANKCSVTIQEIIVKQATAIEIDKELKNVTCVGNDGAIDITVTGGSGNYTFDWSNGATTEDISGLAEGDYEVTVTDHEVTGAESCGVKAKFTLIKNCEQPKGVIAFARKTYEPMAHCFLSDPLLSGYGFTQWGWTNGALPEAEGFTSIYELFINVEGCDVSNAKKVGKIAVQHFGGTATATFTLFTGYTMSETRMYIGNDILPKVGGAYTADPDDLPLKHEGLGTATTDTYSVSVSGSIYIIGYVVLNP